MATHSRFEVILGHVTVIDDARGQEGHKTVEDFCMFAFARVAGDGSHLQGEILDKATVRQFMETQD